MTRPGWFRRMFGWRRDSRPPQDDYGELTGTYRAVVAGVKEHAKALATKRPPAPLATIASRLHDGVREAKTAFQAIDAPLAAMSDDKQRDLRQMKRSITPQTLGAVRPLGPVEVEALRTAFTKVADSAIDLMSVVERQSEAVQHAATATRRFVVATHLIVAGITFAVLFMVQRQSAHLSEQFAALQGQLGAVLDAMKR